MAEKRLSFNDKEVVQDLASVDSVCKIEISADAPVAAGTVYGSIIMDQIITSTVQDVKLLGRDLSKAIVSDVLYALQKSFTTAAETAAVIVEQTGTHVTIYSPIGDVKIANKTSNLGDTKILQEIAVATKNGDEEEAAKLKKAYSKTLKPTTMINGNVSLKIRNGDLVGGVKELKMRVKNVLSTEEKEANKAAREKASLAKKIARNKKEAKELEAKAALEA